MGHPEILGPLEFATSHKYLTDQEATALALVLAAAVQVDHGIEDAINQSDVWKVLTPLKATFERALAAYRRQRK